MYAKSFRFCLITYTWDATLMNAKFKMKLERVAQQLDREQRMAFEGELESLIKKYQSKVKTAKIGKRKIDQFNRTTEKYNKWIDDEVKQRGEYKQFKKMAPQEQYEELHSVGAVPRKETRSVEHITAKSSDPIGELNHAINRMKKLMSKSGQKEKLKISKEAFATAFNLPGGGELDKKIRSAINSLTAGEWEQFALKNKKTIATIWEWYHKMMDEAADPNFLLGGTVPTSMPAMLIDTILTEISGIKKASRAKRVSTGIKGIKKVL